MRPLHKEFGFPISKTNYLFRITMICIGRYPPSKISCQSNFVWGDDGDDYFGRGEWSGLKVSLNDLCVAVCTHLCTFLYCVHSPVHHCVQCALTCALFPPLCACTCAQSTVCGIHTALSLHSIEHSAHAHCTPHCTWHRANFAKR